MFFYVAYQYQDHLYPILGLIALIGHSIVAIVIIPVLPYTWDFGTFHRAGIEVATGGLPSGTSVGSYAAVQGFIYAIFGVSQANAALFSGLFAVLIPIAVHAVIRRLYSQQYPLTLVTILILFLPLPFLLLSLPMRDALSVLLFFTLLATSLRTLQDREYLLGLFIVPLWGMLYLIRTELALVTLLGITAAIAVKFIRTFNIHVNIASLFAILSGAGAVGFFLFAELLYSLERANAELSFRDTGGANYLEGMQYNSWLDFLIAAPGRAIYFQFTPFPFHIESTFHLFGFLGVPITIIIFVSAIRALYQCERNETATVLIVVVYLSGIVGYGVINSNFGTNVRHRVVFEFLLIAVASPVIARWELLLRHRLGIPPRETSENNKKCSKT